MHPLDSAGRSRDFDEKLICRGRIRLFAKNRSNPGRCGKPNCHCHQPHHPGHGPNFRLTYKAQGRTVTETFPSPAARRRAERQIAEFRKFQQLSRAFVEVNEKICRQRPLPEEAEAAEQEKKRPQPSSGRWRRK